MGSAIQKWAPRPWTYRRTLQKIIFPCRSRTLTFHSQRWSAARPRGSTDCRKKSSWVQALTRPLLEARWSQSYFPASEQVSPKSAIIRLNLRTASQQPAWILSSPRSPILQKTLWKNLLRESACPSARDTSIPTPKCTALSQSKASLKTQTNRSNARCR